MTIFDCSFHGDIIGVDRLLDENPGLVHETRRFTVLDQTVTLTPLFLAAIAGQREVVKTLVDRGALLDSNDGDLFSWSCLCPDENKRLRVIWGIFEMRVDEHILGLNLDYRDIAYGKTSKADMGSVQATSYHLTPFDVAFLSNRLTSIPDEIAFAEENAGHFKGLATYRAELYRTLEGAGFGLEHSEMGHHPLFTAAYIGNRGAIEGAIKDGSIDLKEMGVHLAGAAAEGGHIDILELLRKEGVNVDGLLGTTLAVLGALLGRIEVIKWLASLGVDLSGSLDFGAYRDQTPIYLAAVRGDRDMVRELIEVGIDPSLPLESGPKKGLTPAYIAAANNHVGVIEEFRSAGVDLSKPIESGEWEGLTPAYIAAANNHVGVIDALRRAGVDLSKPIESGKWEGCTPIYAAARKDHVEVIEELRSADVDINKPMVFGNWRGQTPAYIGAKFGHLKELKIFREAGTDITKPLESGRYAGCTLAFAAAEKGHVAFLQKLRGVGVSLSMPLESGPWKGWTPLLAGYSHPQVLEYYGIDPSLYGIVKASLQRNPKAGVMHLTSLALDISAAKALVALGISTMGTIRGPGGRLLSAVDFALMPEGPTSGPISPIEQRQIDMLKSLMEHGHAEGDVIEKVRETRPRLYRELASEGEKALEKGLREEDLIRRVLDGTSLPSQEDREIIWRQGDQVRVIQPEDAGAALRFAMESLLSKVDLTDDNSLSVSNIQRLQEILNPEASSFSLLEYIQQWLPFPWNRREIARDEGAQFCEVLQSIEEASHHLMGHLAQSSFPEGEAPCVVWRSKAASAEGIRESNPRPLKRARTKGPEA